MQLTCFKRGLLFVYEKLHKLPIFIFTEKHDDVCNLCIAYPGLCSIDNIVVSIQHCPSSHSSIVRTSVWLRQRPTSNELARAETILQPCPQLVGSKCNQCRLTCQTNGSCHASPTSKDFLTNNRSSDRIHTLTSSHRTDIHCTKPNWCKLFSPFNKFIMREWPLVTLFNMRLYFFVQELTHTSSDHLLFFSVLKVHASLLFLIQGQRPEFSLLARTLK